MHRLALWLICAIVSAGASAESTSNFPGTAPIPVTPTRESRAAARSVASMPEPEREPLSYLDLPEPKKMRTVSHFNGINLDLIFSQGWIQSNGNGEVSSGPLNPGLSVQWGFYSINELELTLLGAIEHRPYRTANLSDPFRASSPWLWMIGLSNRIYLDPDFSVSLDVIVRRRAFSYRLSSTVISGDQGTIPQVGLTARYRFLRTGTQRGAYLGAGVAYLLPTPTEATSANSGYAINGELRWEEIFFRTPWSFGFNIERAKQDTRLAPQGFWNLSFLVGVQFTE